MVDASMSLTMTEFEDQKQRMRELQDRLADTERQLLEGEVLRKKLHNTILVSKYNLATCMLSSSSFLYMR